MGAPRFTGELCKCKQVLWIMHSEYLADADVHVQAETDASVDEHESHLCRLLLAVWVDRHGQKSGNLHCSNAEHQSGNKLLDQLLLCLLHIVS